MYSSVTSPSRRGSFGEIGLRAAEQRAPSSRRLSFLERVDEANESDGLASTPAHAAIGHSRRFSGIVAPPELFSSDEEIENVHRQMIQVRRRSSAKATDRRGADQALVRRSSTLPRRSSASRPPLQNLPRESLRSTMHDASEHALASTLDERKQKKLVALFYWHRRTMETYFSAWKWVVFDDGSRSEPPQRQSEHKLQRPYAPPQIRPMANYTRHESVLPKNTLDRRHSAVSTGRESNHRDRMNSLRGEYRQLKAAALQGQQQLTGNASATQSPQPEEDATTAKCQAFKERLRVFYRCFTAWQEYVDECRIHSAWLNGRTWGHYRLRLLLRFFRVWAKPFLALRRVENERRRRACVMSDRRALRRRFRSWKRWYQWVLHIKCQADAIAQLRMARSISRWIKWIERTARLHQAYVKNRWIVQQRYFARLKTLRICRSQKRLVNEEAVAFGQRQSLRRVWSHWCRSVFADESAAHVQSLTRRLRQKSAVTKWKRFVARRRHRQARAEEADYRLYEGLLRRFWMRWKGYLALRGVQRGVYDYATSHLSSHRKRRGIRGLLSHRCVRKYELDRALAARRFYLFRQGRKSLCAWRAHVYVAQSCRQFQYVRVKRQFVICFLAWRQYSKRSRRLRSRQATMYGQQRGRLLKQSMRMWWYRYKQCSTYRLVDARCESRLLDRCLKRWRTITAQRRYWNSLIQQLNRKRSRHQRRRLLSAWRQFAVGMSCRRRLIRLFRKKHLIKKLRNCVRVLHQHANFLRLIRSINSRRLESAWHSWVTYTSDQLRRTEADNTASQFFSTRRYSLAVGLWRRNTRRWCRARRDNAQAFGHLIDRILRKTFLAWYRTSRKQIRRRELVEIRVAKSQRLQLERCLTQWNIVVRVRCRRRHEIHRMWCRAMRRQHKLVFFAWRLYLTHKNAHQRMLLEVQRAFEQRRGREMLRAWRVAAIRLRRHRVIIQVKRSHYQRCLLERVLCEWRRVAAKSHRRRMNNLTAAKYHREFLLLWVFYGWQQAVLVLQVVREKQMQAVQAIARKKLERAVQGWRRRLTLGKENKASIQRAVKFYRSRRHRIAVTALGVLLTSRRKRQEQSRLAMATATTKLKRRALHAWLLFTAGTRAFKTKLRAVFEADDRDVQRRALRCWRRYKRKTTLVCQATQWRHRSLQQKMWRHWRHHVTFTRMRRRNVLIMNQRLQSNATRASFTKWAQYVASRHLAERTLSQAEDHYTAQCYGMVIRRLRTALLHSRATKLSAAFREACMQREYFGNWRRGAVAQKARREQSARMTERSKCRRMHRAFSGWNELVATRQRILQSKADLHRNSMVSQHAWKAWKGVVMYRHLVVAFRTRQYHQQKRTSFRQWMDFVEDQQQIRRHVEVAVAHVDRVTMEKIWERWIEFLGERQKSRRVNSAASSLYSTRMQQRCFSVWLTYVSYRHDRRAQQLEADALCVLMSWRRSFERWEFYVAYCNAHKAAKQSDDETISRFIMTRAVRTWRLRASTSRSLSEAQTRATRFFEQRAESKAVHFLLLHATKKKRSRKYQTHAIAHRKHRLSQHVFTRWKSFLTWLKRHKHFRRAFRSNQLRESFALWRKYVARTQRQRTLQTKAMRGHCALVQRSAFACWYGRCRQWRGKRQASDWRTLRVSRIVFDAWVQHVRALRKMRQLSRFQDSCRLESHFHMWRRRWWRKKQRLVQDHEAMEWYQRRLQAQNFALWARWMSAKHQEKAAMRMATGFRLRFICRTFVHAWRSVVLWKRRKLLLQATAQQSYRIKLYRNALSRIRAYAELRKQIRDTTLSITRVLANARVQRSVITWKRFLLSRQELRCIGTVAVLHRRRRVLQRCWGSFRRWNTVRQVKRSGWQRAQRYDDHAITRRTFHAWRFNVVGQRRLSTGLERFKERFFRSVMEYAFVRWASLVAFKRQLRILKRKIEQSAQRHALHAWRTVAHNFRRRRVVSMAMDARRSRRLLQHCVRHWESVATDSWMYMQLVCTGLSRRGRRTKICVIHRWKALLPLRRARREWRQKARVRHRQLLVDILHSWRWYSVEHGSTSDQVRCDAGDGNLLVNW